ncbi:hypothetical protein A2U01_0082463, partial [Trifolium medium]|nr:hypothetical protein [Trifolium medium]
LDMAADDESYPDKVLGTRMIKREGLSVSQSLIQWKDKSIDDGVVLMEMMIKWA